MESYKRTCKEKLDDLYFETINKLRYVKKGNVVNISSVNAILTKPNFSAYATSKAGLIGLTKSLAVVFLSDNNNFLNGSILDLSGGISSSSSLYDPILE
jgi:NAD(P)-dependent dehydrogenase (short-subunit alcohol dehydrogenase family)